MKLESNLRSATDIMRRNLVTLCADTFAIDGVAKLLKHKISGAPVLCPEGRYRAVFSEKCSINAMTDVVRAARQRDHNIDLARDFMTNQVVTLSMQMDVFDAIDHLLSKQISGAPVVDEAGNFLGVFSEKTAMTVLVSAAYDRMPGLSVASYLNRDMDRIVAENDCLLQVARKFQTTGYRRLPVLRGRRLVGQISRRDVLRAEHRVCLELRSVVVQENQANRFVELVLRAEIADYMDCEAKCVGPNTDLLTIAQLFLTTPYRRLPVLDSGRLLGQVSRRDLLKAAADLIRPRYAPERTRSLYLSSLNERRPESLV